MSIDFCALCNDPCTGANASIGNNSMQELWRTLVAQALCGLVNSNPDIVVATQLDQVAITAATLTSTYTAYASAGFLDSALKLRRFTAINQTDSDIDISLDAGTSTHFRILAGTTRSIELGNYEFALITDFMIKRSFGMTAGTGSFYLEGGY